MFNSLVLKEISSVDIDGDLRCWQPRKAEDVFVSLDMEIGFSSEDEVNFFYVSLATPEALMKYRKAPYLVKNRTLVVSEYSYDELISLINEILESSTRKTWEESCSVLQRYFDWEYEDYLEE